VPVAMFQVCQMKGGCPWRTINILACYNMGEIMVNFAEGGSIIIGKNCCNAFVDPGRITLLPCSLAEVCHSGD